MAAMRIFWRIVLFLYLLAVAFAVLVAAMATSKGGGNDLLVGTVVAVPVGLPWSALVFALPNDYGRNDMLYMWLCVACSGINIWWLVRWAFDADTPRNLIDWVTERLPLLTMLGSAGIGLAWLVRQYLLV